jgi:hypothetical protein
MAHTFRHDEALAWQKIDDAIFEVDQEMPIEHEKEFIDLFVFVPVIFALHHGHPDDRVVHLAQRLVVPFVCASICQLLHIDQFKRPAQNIKISFVWEFFGAVSRIHAANLTAEHTEVAEKTEINWLCDLCVQESLFFPVKIIGFLTLNNDAILR